MSDIFPFETEFAHSVTNHKYMAPHGETHWFQTAERSVVYPMRALREVSPRNYYEEETRLVGLVQARKFIPGGRYLYASGNDFHQTQNCLLLRCEDSREGWADLSWKAEMSLLTGAGLGTYWGDVRPNGSLVTKTGGTASGPLPKAIQINETGRSAVQGGDRRAAIWGGLPWFHDDIFDWIKAKDWPQYIRDAKAEWMRLMSEDPQECERRYPNGVPAPLDMTNISVCLDDAFFAFMDGEIWSGLDYLHEQAPDWMRAADGGLTAEYLNKDWVAWAREVYKATIDSMTQTGEPGFSVDTGEAWAEKLRNAPVAAATNVLTDNGYRQVGDIVGQPTTVWTGKQWAENVVFERTMTDAEIVKVTMTGGREIRCEPTHEFLVERYKGAGKTRRFDRIDRIGAGQLRPGDQLHVALPAETPSVELDVDAYTLGYIYGDGSFCAADNAEVTFCSPESQERCAPIVAQASRLSSLNECDARGFKRAYFRADHGYFASRSKDLFPADVYAAPVSEQVSFLAGLYDADGSLDAERHLIRLSSKHREFLRGVARLLEQHGIVAHLNKGGISTYGGAQGWLLVVARDFYDRFSELVPCHRLSLVADPDYQSYRASAIKVLAVEADGREDVFCADVKVDEHSFMAEGVIISNCTEIVSEDDSDICNLGGLVISKFETPEEFGEAVKLGVLYLTAGTVYSHVPYAQVDEIRTKNRRLGLDLIGVHEFLLKRDLKYGTPEAFEALDPYMVEYDKALEYAHEWQEEAGLSLSVAATSGAPTGTRGIVAETTTGWEPVTYTAYRRSVITSKAHKTDERTEHYVVDPTVERLLREGYILPTDDIEDSSTLALDYERRFAMQAYAQAHTDQAISMTINLPHVMTDPAERAEFGDTLMKYLPKLRGITVYPDGAIAGQPITRVPLAEALGMDYLVEEDDEKCAAGACGI